MKGVLQTLQNQPCREREITENEKTIFYSDDSTINTFTFANIGLYRPELFAGYSIEKIKLASILKPAILNQQVTGEYFAGQWHNMGAAEQLNAFRLTN